MLDQKLELPYPADSLHLFDTIFRDYTTWKVITLYFCFQYVHITNGVLIKLEVIILHGSSYKIFNIALSSVQFSGLDSDPICSPLHQSTLTFTPPSPISHSSH